jgi:uncharacterized protein YndB with AHSA1/START domain
MSSADADGTAVIERWLPAPPAVAFQYFTVAEKWLRWNGTEARIDARPGGSLRIAAYGDYAVGVFREVTPHSRLVFTWGWESGSPVPPESTLVRIEFEPANGGTQLRITHSLLATLEMVERHRRRWGEYLDIIAGFPPG